MQRLSFLDDISFARSLFSESLVFRLEPNYKCFYETMLDILGGPFFNRSQLYGMGIKNLNLLYEIWCVLVILDALLDAKSEGWSIEDQKFFRRDTFGGLMDFDEKTSGKLFTLRKGDLAINMFYHREYKNKVDAYYKSRFPDIVFEYHRAGRFEKILVLDPKYRQKRNRDNGEDNTEGSLPKMHLYKDAIVYDGKRLVKGAYALDLGDLPLEEDIEDDLVKHNVTYKVPGGDPEDVIGAIALRPSKSKLSLKKQLECLQNIILNFS